MNECEYQEICPTTNFWIKDKKNFIQTVCKTEDCELCTLRIDFKAEKIQKNSEDWKKRVQYFAERRKQFPPYGLINMKSDENE